jgi:hypothetical protein
VLASDYRYRGVSLSNGQPVVQGDLGRDLPGGSYAGLFASPAQLADAGALRSQLVGYGGWARRVGSGWSLDLGASYSAFPGNPEYEFLEWHAGLAANGVELRLSYAPNYFGDDLHTFYLEASGSFAPLDAWRDHLRCIWHAGELRPQAQGTPSLHANADAKAGLLLSWRAARLEVARVFNQGSVGAYPLAYASYDHGTWLAQLSVGF